MKHILTYLFKTLCFLNPVCLFTTTTSPLPPMPVTTLVSGIDKSFMPSGSIYALQQLPLQPVLSCNFLKYLKLLRVHGHNKGYII